jgi:hypothetical protein
MVKLNKSEQEALDRIRSAHGGSGESGHSSAITGTTDNSRFSEQGDTRGDGTLSYVGNEIGTVGSASREIDSWNGRDGQQDRNGDTGAGQAEPDASGVLQSGNRRGEQAGASSTQLPHLKLGKAPSGLIGIPSRSEIAQRPVAPDQEEDPATTIASVIRISRDGRKRQVKFKNGKWAWVPNPDGTTTLPFPAEVHGTPTVGTTLPFAKPVKIAVDNTPKTPPNAYSASKPPPAFQNPLAGIKLQGVLSLKESDDARTKMFEINVLVFDTLDKGITATTTGHPALVIWSDMDDSDIETLVDFQLSRARKSAAAAEGIRRILDLYVHLKVGSILLPRFVKTWNAYVDFGLELPGKRRSRRQRIVN